MQLLVIDGKEQNWARGLVATGGYWGCGTCYCKGESNAAGTKRYYPPAGLDSPLRSREDWLKLWTEYAGMMEKVKAGNQKYLTETAVVRRGVLRWTPLLELRRFCLVLQIPFDVLHSVHLGATKRTFEQMFLPKGLFGNAKRRKEVFDKLEKSYTRMKVPTEVRHKPHGLNPSNMKASGEFAINRNVLNKE